MHADSFKLIGTVIDGKYRVDEVIGEGGFGVVYKGFHTTFEHKIAIKCLKMPPHFVPEAQKVFFEKFREEGKLLSQLSSAHMSIVRVFDFGVTKSESVQSIPYLILEWLEGASLEDSLKERRGSGLKPHTEREAIELLLPAIEAISAAHEMNVAHRDIKPPNIYVLSRSHLSSKGATIKVLDFGIAKAMQEGETATQIKTRTSSGFSAFSPQHGSPEQFLAKRFGSTGPWTDVYALGLCLVELVSGRTALDGEEVAELFEASTSDIRPTPRNRGAVVSDEFEAVCAKALAKMPKDRFPNAGALHGALEDILLGRPLNLDRGPPRVSLPTPAPANAAIDTAVFLQARGTDGKAPAKEAESVAKVGQKTVAAAPLMAEFTAPAKTDLAGAVDLAPVIAPPAERSREEKKTSAAIYVAPVVLVMGGLGIWYAFGANGPTAPKEVASSSTSAAPSSAPVKPPDTSAEGFKLFWNRSDPNNLPKSIELFQRSCDAGFQDGCAGLGFSFYAGALGKLDPVRAHQLFEASCAAGSLMGCDGLGDSYFQGFGVKKNPVKAAQLLTKSCDGGEMRSCKLLGILVGAGMGAPKDLKRSFDLFNKACTGGDIGACSNLGSGLLNGIGADKDEKKGIEWINKSCDGGNPFGCLKLASAFHDGTGVPKDLARSADIYQKACDNGGHYGGQFGCQGVAAAYETGSGVKQDAAKAAELYAKANALNEEECGFENGNACLALADAYGNGEGVTKDIAKEIEYNQKACDAATMEGCSLLAVAYAEGNGVKKDIPHSLSLFQKACDGGDLDACFFLAGVLEANDRPTAIILYRRACAGDVQSACDNLKKKGLPLTAPADAPAAPADAPGASANPPGAPANPPAVPKPVAPQVAPKPSPNDPYSF